jgi:formamidopyrimidine-DNA glycosylase
MPELPEVESVRRGLMAARISAPIAAVWRSEHALRMSGDLAALIGARPGAVGRRGKYLLWEMDAAGEALGLLLHLGMSGRFGVASPSDPRVKHTHFVLRLEDDRELRFVDPRRFGGFLVGAAATLQGQPPLAGLGPEPLDAGFDGALLAARLGASERCLRDALLDQRAVAGVGNIYAVEALFLAGLHPLTPARSLRASAWARLAEALQHVLNQGIASGGTTLKDFRNVTGEVGRGQDDLKVYGREGEPCPRCGQALRGFVHGGRSGVFCPSDQPRRQIR